MRRQVVLVFFLSLTAWYSSAQAPHFQSYFLLRKGEPVQINKIFQDSKGYVWFASDKGLFRFDGINQVLVDGTTADPVTALAEDEAGVIWAGTREGMMWSIGSDMRAVAFEPPEGTAAAEISDILFDKSGNLWFSTFNDGLYYYTAERLYRLDDTDGMPDLYVYDIEEDSSGNIWAGTDGGAAIVRLLDKKPQIEVIDYGAGLPDNIVRKVKMDGDKVLLAMEDAGVVSYDPRSRSMEPLFEWWSYGAINDFCVDNAQVWFATASGLIVLERNISLVSAVENVAGMSSVSTILKDVEGNVWAGSRTSLVRCFNNYVQYIDPVELQGGNVLAVAADKEGIWYSTDNGLFRRTIVNGRPVVKPLLRGTRYHGRKIISLYVDEEGYLWCGFYGEGVIRLHPSASGIEDLGRQLRNGNVLSISGAGGDVWMATLDGATRVRKSGGALTVDNFGKKEGLNADYIYQVFTDSKGRTWFGSDRQGVVMMENNTFRHFGEGFGTRAVYGFAEDGHGEIWVNVQLDGLYILRGDHFVKVRSDQNVNALVASRSGRILAVHDLGLEVHQLGDSAIRRFGEEVGFIERQANLNAVTRGPNGRIYIGTDKGIVVFTEYPAGIMTAPVPLIGGIRAFNVAHALEPGLTLAYDENNVTVSFLGIWFQNPMGLRFQYRLDGYDIDWIATQDRNATFSRLQPGNYTFWVRVSDSDDFSAAKDVSLTFVVTPPFWRTVPFYLVVALAVGLAVYSFIRLREKRLQQDMQILEEKVRQRTSEIRRKNEEIQAQAEEIKAINESLERRVHERTHELERKNKALEEYAFINAHNLRSPVASILGLINLLSSVDLDDSGKELIGHMKSSAERLDSVVRSITESIEKGDGYEGFEESESDGID
jgi:ligand-binding sensor domain-containing protein